MSTSLDEIRKPEVMPAAPVYQHIPTELQNWFDPLKFAQLQRVAAMFAASNQVPDHFRGNAASCAIALDLAFRMNISPMMALQNMHVVHGNPGLSSQLCIALANKSEVFEGPIDFDVVGSGDNLTVTAFATLARSKKVVRLTVSYKQAMDAGWPKQRDGGIKPFWKAMPEQMLRYRSAVFLIRTYAPDVMLGMHTKEEWEDLGDGVEARVTPPAADRLATLMPAKSTKIEGDMVAPEDHRAIKQDAPDDVDNREQSSTSRTMKDSNREEVSTKKPTQEPQARKPDINHHQESEYIEV